MTDIAPVNIEDCARCGERHKNIKVFSFTRIPENVLIYGEPITHFAVCPETYEPLLINIRATFNK